ncbi:MAG: malate dehydrogenase [Desulfobacteraceae bacterium]|nr:malate dehydrogenase [Desulfobacteraceae bacterium]
MIGIIGSGNVGANTAFFLVEKGVDHVTLYDIQKGIAHGKALDMMEAAPIRGYRTTIQGTDNPDDVVNSDIVILTAGSPRKSGMKRDALYHENRKIVEGYAQRITNPDTKVIIVTEPLDVMTTVFAEKSILPSSQILGLGGLLDATRLRFLIAHELKVSMENVAAQVVGRHTRDMILLKDYCCVSGMSIDNFLSEEKINELFEQTRNAGALIVEMAGRASAYYGPSAVAAELAEAISLDMGRVLSVSQVLNGQFGIGNVALSLPALIGRTGIKQVVEPSLTKDEIKTLKRSARLITQIIEEAGHA